MGRSIASKAMTGFGGRPLLQGGPGPKSQGGYSYKGGDHSRGSKGSKKSRKTAAQMNKKDTIVDEEDEGSYYDEEEEAEEEEESEVSEK